MRRDLRLWSKPASGLGDCNRLSTAILLSPKSAECRFLLAAREGVALRDDVYEGRIGIVSRGRLGLGRNRVTS